MGKYLGKDNHGKPKKDFLSRLKNKTDEELFDVCDNYIWLSAYASNNSRSDYHWMCDACYDECEARNRRDIYRTAWNRLYDVSI
jgi:hypothetical protein